MMSSLRRRKNSFTVNQLTVQIEEWQVKVNSLRDAKEFHDPETASTSGLSNVPSEPMSIPSQEEWLAAIIACRLLHRTHWVHQTLF